MNKAEIFPDKSRKNWLICSIISVNLLIVSFFFENSILILLDGSIPIIFILYIFFSKKQIPFYYYLICSCGIYNFYWIVFLFPDFRPESIYITDNISLPIVMNALGELVSFGIGFILLIPLLILCASKVEKLLIGNSIKKIIRKTKLSVLSVVITIAILIFSMFCSLNVTLDEPNIEKTVYVIRREYRFKNPDYPRMYKGVGETLIYKHLPESEIEYSIEYNHIFTPENYDKEGNWIAKIQYGKGAFGLEWRRIVE